jgi:GNAT superfamily N-acetyltransferase
MTDPVLPEQFRIERATERDVPLIFSFIKDLAEYEQLAHEVAATEDGLRAALFGPTPAAEVVIGYVGGEAVGFALFFQTFSTFVGKPGMYLEDLFVRPEWRGRGYGKQLLVHLARICLERDYGRMEWSVLDWNELALGVYRRVGARPLGDWTVHRLTGEPLRRLASES